MRNGKKLLSKNTYKPGGGSFLKNEYKVVNNQDEHIYEGEVIDDHQLEHEDIDINSNENTIKSSSEELLEDTNDWQSRHYEREAERAAVKQRVRNSTSSKEFFHPGKPTPDIMDDTTKRVAVYARVSTMNIEQTSSIENQEKFYTKKINETPNWELQKIYSDEGKSGTSVTHRKAFQQLMKDALNGEMDMIICASVSRFARNISQCLDYVSELRTANPKHPVGVYFETENIYTLNPDSEQAFTMHAMLADWESANKSRRMILSYDQRICTGQYQVVDLLGYRHTKDGQLIIKEDEAQTVRFIFLALLIGKNCSQIAEVLTEKKRKTLKGSVEWDGTMVGQLITNERRWGDLEARKTIVLDYKKKKIVKNNEMRDWAYVPGHHEGIVTPEIAKAAQLMAASSGRLQRGMPELKIIDKGSLKGYVSVCPYWNDISSEFYIESCQSVYTDDELAKLTKDIKIWSGEIKSNVISMNLRGYEVPPGIVFLTNSMPSITISNKDIIFNKSCLKKLGMPEWIEMFYHPMIKSIVIRKSTADNPNSFRMKTDNGNLVKKVTFKMFCNLLYKDMDWINDYSFKFRGITKVRGNNEIIFFSLDEPQILVGKQRKNKNADFDGKSQIITDDRSVLSSADNTPSRYINYTNSSVSETIDTSMKAFPRDWKNNSYRRNYYFKKQREKMLTEITEDDICEEGVTAQNSIVSSLPSRQEILNELNDLLNTM